jgi:hypothetical protein
LEPLDGPATVRLAAGLGLDRCDTERRIVGVRDYGPTDERDTYQQNSARANAQQAIVNRALHGISPCSAGNGKPSNPARGSRSTSNQPLRVRQIVASG